MRASAPWACVFAALALSSAGCADAPDAKSANEADRARREQSPEMLVQRGRGFAAAGDLTRAEQYLAAALEAGAEHRVVLPVLLRVCLAEHRLRVAIDYVEPILGRNPDDYRLRMVLASLYMAIGDAHASQTHLEAALRHKKDLAEAHYRLGLLLREEGGDLAAATEHLREYLREAPGGDHAAEVRSVLVEGSR